MKRPVKYAVSLLLMTCFGMSALMYLFFDIAQAHFKQNARENMVQSDGLQTIKLPLSKFNNNKEHEIWLQGKLYDINNYVVVNDTAVISVYQDNDEMQLIKSITDSFAPDESYSSPDNIPHISKVHVHNGGGAKILVARWQIHPVYSSLVHFLSGNSAPDTITSYQDVIKPPPRLSAFPAC